MRIIDRFPIYWISRDWWSYLLYNDRGGRWNRGIPWVNLWSPITDLYEMAYWFRTRRYRWLFEETMPERILCRIKGHPKGEIFFNASGYEPDHRCRGCGEDLG